MFAKLFHLAEVDICPKCGATCALNVQLCPRCGSDLDALFEQIDIDEWLAHDSSRKRRSYAELAAIIVIMSIVSATVICGVGFILLSASQDWISSSSIPHAQVCIGMIYGSKPEIGIWWHRTNGLLALVQYVYVGSPYTICRLVPAPDFIPASGGYSLP